MEEVHFWRSLELEAVIFFNWLRAPRTVDAMKRAGLFVISRGDTDGHASVRVFPRAAWMALDSEDDLLDRLRKIKHLAHRCLSLSVAEDQALLETIEHTDAVAVECEEAAKNLGQILHYYRRSDLAKKLHVVPHSVSDATLSQTVDRGPRPRTIVCGGRWNDPQKDAHLLTAVLDLLLDRRNNLQIVIVGPGGDHLFGRLTRRHPEVTWMGRVAHDRIAEILTNSRVILSSSRWEGYSIITLEALCMGCTLAAPPLPGFISMAEDGRYGTISAQRNPASLAQAVEKELEIWDNGLRVPAEIAAIWRKRVSNDSVVSDLISLIS
jgi:glycosyltransferase involved in cell wall biosynthesis